MRFLEKYWIIISGAKLPLASPTMHDPELEYMKEAYETNWMSTVGDIAILATCH